MNDLLLVELMSRVSALELENERLRLELDQTRGEHGWEVGPCVLEDGDK